MQRSAAERTQLQASDEARDQSAEYEGEGLDTGDRCFEVEAFFEAVALGSGQRRFDLFATRARDEVQDLGAEPRCQIATRQAEQIVDAMNAKAGEGLCGLIVRVEQIDREGREEGQLIFRGQDLERFVRRGFEAASRSMSEISCCESSDASGRGECNDTR
jgi:hypothetical protein